MRCMRKNTRLGACERRKFEAPDPTERPLHVVDTRRLDRVHRFRADFTKTVPTSELQMYTPRSDRVAIQRPSADKDSDCSALAEGKLVRTASDCAESPKATND